MSFFLPVLPKENDILGYKTSFYAKRGNGYKVEHVCEKDGHAIAPWDKLVPGKTYYMLSNPHQLNGETDVRGHYKEQRLPHAFNPMECKVPTERFSDLIRFAMEDSKTSKTIDIIDMNPQSYAQELGLADVKGKFATFACDAEYRYETEDLTSRQGTQVYCKLVDDWIRFVRIIDLGKGLEKGKQGTKLDLSFPTIKPGMPFSVCEELVKRGAAEEFENCSSVAFLKDLKLPFHHVCSTDALSHKDFGTTIYYNITHTLNLFQLDTTYSNQLKYVEDKSLDELLSTQLYSTPRKDYRFTFYEDKDRKVQITGPLTRPPKSNIWFEEIERPEDFVIKPVDGSKNITISIPRAWRTSLLDFMTELVKLTATRWNKSINLKDQNIGMKSLYMASRTFDESNVALVSFAGPSSYAYKSLSGENCITQFPHNPIAVLGEYALLISSELKVDESKHSVQIKSENLSMIPEPHQIFEFTIEESVVCPVVAMDIQSGKTYDLEFQRATLCDQPLDVIYLPALEKAIAEEFLCVGIQVCKGLHKKVACLC